MKAFASLINQYNFRHLQRRNRTARDIHIESPNGFFGLLLSAYELEKLNTILQKGLLIVAAQDPVAQQ
ncbi:hypothetical protein E1J53_0019380 [Lewinella sp. W8]|nr:hypothetical protein [Lewinella sp. W8]MTB53145.1 hypothetical protein [Lewinella sp. W8]